MPKCDFNKVGNSGWLLLNLELHFKETNPCASAPVRIAN